MSRPSSASKKSRGANQDDEFQTDSFDFTKPIDIQSDVCALCKQGHEFGLLLKHSLPQISRLTHSVGDTADDGDEINLISSAFADPTEVWISRYSISSSNRRIFVHFHCALACPRVWFTGTEWRNVRREIIRGSSMICTGCGLKGATIGCMVDRCTTVLHLPCAIKEGYLQLRYNAMFYCQDHRLKLKQDAIRQQQTLLIQQGRASLQQDISRGKENVPVKYKNIYDKSTPLDPIAPPLSLINVDENIDHFAPPTTPRPFQYVVHNVDSDEVISSALNVEEVDNCACVDLCDDVNGCSCIEYGRNYTYQGTLLPGITHRIRECNMKCSCSYRRCTNRVVERGLNAHLEIFRSRDELHSLGEWTDIRKKKKSTNRSSPTKEARNSSSAATETSGWGVRTLDFIPQFSFVCEVMGQWFLLNDEDRSLAREDWAIKPRRIRVLGWEEEQIRYDAQMKDKLAVALAKHKQTEEAMKKPKSRPKRRRFGDYDLGGSSRKKSKSTIEPPNILVIPSTDDDNTEVHEVYLLDDVEDVGDHEDTNNVSSAESLSSAANVDNGSWEKSKEGKQGLIIEQLLVDNLCLDCNQYGNVGAFLRRAKPGTKPMFIKKLVFNSTKPDAVPKLALFAAMDIAPMTELLI